MTIGELSRAISSKLRTKKLEAQERATFDYSLGQLIGIACGRAFGSIKNDYPEISTMYPTLFDSKEIQEKKQEKQAELSALRFKQFAQSFNQRFNKEEVAEVE